MSSQGSSSPSPNKPAVRQRRLEHLTKVAVDRAYKLRAESRRLVHIVDTHSCRNSKPFGCSSPLSSFISAVPKYPSSTPSSFSRNWALPKGSNDRRSVAARIHTLLNQWRADSSFDWRARVASVVPVLEEVVYKEAKSQEEYSNPLLLEVQLMNVLSQFEAGNGPFLLQGSTPLYPVRACYSPGSLSHRMSMSPLCQSASTGGGVSLNGITSGETHEGAEADERGTRNSCHGSERMRRTLGGMLKMERCSTAAPLASNTTTWDTRAFHTEEATLSLGTTDEAARNMVCADLRQGADFTCGSMSLSSTSTPPPPPPSSPLPCQGPLSLPSPSCSSSSSPSQQQFTHASIAYWKPFPQHQSSSFSQQSAPLSSSSDVHSMETSDLIHEDHQNAALDVRTDALLQSRQGKEPAVQIAFEHSTTQTAPKEQREAEKGESSLSMPMTSSTSASNEEASKRREKGAKLTLSSFLAKREEHQGCISSYQEGGPRDTWEEATEQLDGMCCVCVVGFKGAAFIPCGHTFCRKCTRELRRGRGTCPLCNRHIREILDIY